MAQQAIKVEKQPTWPVRQLVRLEEKAKEKGLTPIEVLLEERPDGDVPMIHWGGEKGNEFHIPDFFATREVLFHKFQNPRYCLLSQAGTLFLNKKFRKLATLEELCELASGGENEIYPIASIINLNPQIGESFSDKEISLNLGRLKMIGKEIKETKLSFWIPEGQELNKKFQNFINRGERYKNIKREREIKL